LPPDFKGAFRLYRLAGVEVYIHWSWFIAAYFLIKDRPVVYSSLGWDVAEYLAGFAVVLMHELGHVFACRSVGGAANRILLWPLGGLAFVAPPPRPGAELWTTVAGPLVNVVLFPVLYVLALATAPGTDEETISDWCKHFNALYVFNIVILVFNLLPIFPLDGGRILHSILWYCFGPVVGLAIAAGVGVVVGPALLVLALTQGEWWLAATCAFLTLGAIGGLARARMRRRLRGVERRSGLACPFCKKAPPVGAFWMCTKCHQRVDDFQTSGPCPVCETTVETTLCFDCWEISKKADWGGREVVL
jgi:Zn-dependent protease